MLITFVTNSAELTPKAKEMLAVLARALQSDKLAQFKFSIEGHADPRGGEELNLQLSQLRAEAVVKYLSEQQNISESRLVAVGKGQSELMNTRDPSAPENRRVTVKTVVE
jgi:outer membrane protein OmpA-like peptidoglycan-associated protein